MIASALSLTTSQVFRLVGVLVHIQVQIQDCLFMYNMELDGSEAPDYAIYIFVSEALNVQGT